MKNKANKTSFKKGHPFFKGGEKGWFKKGQISWIVKQNRIFVNCQICHKKFQTTKFKVRKGRKYCSWHCYNLSKIGIGNHNWKGGIIFRNERWWKRMVGHPRANKYSPYVKIAVLNMEKEIGRYLKFYEIVHHINEIKSDDRIENLKLLQSNSEHRKLHRQFKTLEDWKNHKNEYQRKWRKNNSEKVKAYKKSYRRIS